MFRLLSALMMAITQVWNAGCQLDPSANPRAEEEWQTLREAMVRTVRQTTSLEDPALLEALGRVPRHRFVPEEYRRYAYNDTALPIGYRQTISQPSLVALMTATLKLTGPEKVLEVGTGSGYQTALLAELAKAVHSIERIA
ncbi:MAG: protein-L-isoaspartate O-methyltransferase family protein, partial [Nitrospirales bacterium]